MKAALLVCLLSGACDQPAPVQATPRDAHPAPVALPQTPDAAWADYQAAMAAPPSPVSERDGEDRPLLYYGRAFVRSDMELRALDLLKFLHAERPFFDEYQATPGRPAAGDYQRGNWEYAVATGAQWNALIRYPGIVSAVQLNPKLAVAPHPMLDELSADLPPGAVALEKLAQLGLQLPSPPELTSGICSLARSAALLKAGLTADAVEELLFDTAGYVANVIKGLGGTIDDVIKAVYDGVSEATDQLRKLGNRGVCALSGTRSHSGTVYLDDPHTGKRFATAFGSEAGLDEPFRHTGIRARGGPGGILLTTTTTDAIGRYSFDNFCGSTDYTIALLLSAPQAWFTEDGLSTEQIDLGTVRSGDDFIAWTVHDSAEAAWLMGMQLGYENAQARFGFIPKKAKVVTGTFAEEVVGRFSNNASIASCGELGLVSALLLADIPFGNLTNADIYMLSRSAHLDPNDAGSGPGVAAHEYGHHAMCEAIRQLGGDLDSFLNYYVVQLIGGVVAGRDPLSEPVRNTAEAIADYSAFLTMGYTDYFFSDSNNLHVCGSWEEPRDSCLEDDASFSVTPSPDPRSLVASRASILFDWVARTVNPRAPSWPTAGNHLGLRADVVSQAAAHAGAQVTTDNLAGWVALSDEYGRPAEALCRIQRDHGWSCGPLETLPVTLEAPSGLTGVATGIDTISWSWAPTSVLAQSYTLVNAQGSSFSDVETIDANSFRVVQKIPGATGNQRIVAAVESRREGATAGRTARVARCTLAAPVTGVVAAATAGGVELSWAALDASDFRVSRADGSGSFLSLATVSGNRYLDGDAAPGVEYRYRVAARNCDGVDSQGADVVASRGMDDSLLLFVDAAAAAGDGTRAQPFARLGDALLAVTATRRTLAVAGGIYTERLAVTQDGVAIYGGYAPGFQARDPDRHPTSIIGDGSSWTVNRSSDKIFPNPMAPLVYAAGDQLTLDGLDFSPGSLLCPGCLRVGLAFTVGALDLIRVHYHGWDGRDVDRATSYDGVYCGLSAGNCRIVDSTLREWPSPTLPVHAVSGFALTLENSTLVGGIIADQLTMDRTVVRIDPTAWSPPGVAVAAGCAFITSSLLAGGTALQLSARALPCLNAVVSSTLYGVSVVRTSRLIDDIFISDGPVPLQIADGGNALIGQVVRNNLFVTLVGQDVAITQQQAFGSVPPSLLNDPATWFNSPDNDVGQNQLAGALDPLFADTAPGPVGRTLHPLASAPLLGAGVDPRIYGYTLTHDLDGRARSTSIFDIGPYQASEP